MDKDEDKVDKDKMDKVDIVDKDQVNNVDKMDKGEKDMVVRMNKVDRWTGFFCHKLQFLKTIENTLFPMVDSKTTHSIAMVRW